MKTPSWLPPLPEPETLGDAIDGWAVGYTAEQMRQAQLDAVEAYRASSVPVAWAVYQTAGPVLFLRDPSPDGLSIPLYRLDEEMK
jgi:hypothetical protein